MSAHTQRRSTFLRAFLAGTACLLCGATLFLAAGSALSATYFSRQTGNWNVNTTWSTVACGSGVVAATAPGAADAIQICNVTHTVTVTASTSAASLTFIGGTLAATLTINSNVLLTINGDATVNAPTAAVNKTINLATNADLTVNGDLTLIGGGAANRNARLVLASDPGTIVTVTGNLAGTVAGGAFNARGVISFSGLGTIRIGGDFANGATLTSATGTIEFNGTGAQSIPSYNTAGATNNYNHLTIDKTSGTATLAGSILVRGNFTSNATSAFSAGASCAVSPFTVTFNGAAAQNLLGTAAGTNFCRVTLNNATHLTLAHNLNISSTANGLLTLTSGQIITGANRVYIPNGTTIASAGGSDFIFGNLTKSYAINAGSVSRFFEVGTQAGGNRYALATLIFTNVTVAGDITVSSTAGTHPSLGSSGLNTSEKLNRYWTLTNGGPGLTTAVFATYQATFSYVAADLDAGANPLVFAATRFASNAWNPTSFVNATATSITIGSETGFGEFAAGEVAGYNATLGRFNAYDPSPATPLNSVHGYIRTKVAGTGFSLTIVHLDAAGTSLATLGSAGSPVTVTVSLLDASTSTGFFAGNCWTSWSIVRSVTVTFSGQNQRTATFTGVNIETDSWREMRVAVYYPTAASPTEFGCSGDRFAIRPDRLAVSAHDTDWQSTGVTRALANSSVTGGNVHAAGRQFTLRAIGQTAALATTSNYDGTPTVLTNTCALPASGCTLGTLALGAWSGTGTRTLPATYDEAGAINLALEDLTYANVDLSDSTLVQRRVPQSVVSTVVGRFVPDRFTVVVEPSVTPSFKTFNTTTATCSAARSFTYIGQPFSYLVSPQANITAQNASGVAIQNYKGTLWKIGDLTGSTAPALVKDCTTNPNICQFTTTWSTAGATSSVIESYTYTLAPVSTPGWDNTGSAPAAASVNTGTGRLTIAPGDALAFQRNTTTPQVPFNATVNNSITVRDNSEVAVTGNGSITTTSAASFSNIAFDGTDFNAAALLTAGKTFVYGRLRLSNASGSQLLPLPVPMELQYWNGSSFITNAADRCTTLAATNASMGNYQTNLGPLASCKTTMGATMAFTAGRSVVQLTAPGNGNNGSVDLTVLLDGSAPGSNSCVTGSSPPPQATSGANRLYLQGNWTGATYTQNPVSRATFGVYRGSDELIYFREIF